MSVKPAILGNQPIFTERIPITKPTLPDFSELESEMRAIVESGILSKGPHRVAFEEAVADHLGVKHAVGVSSCTTGLMLSYQALGLSGTEVVVPSFTFMATVSALRWAGAKPVFADVDLETTNLCPSAAAAAITPATSAIVAVHNSGNPAEIAELEAIATRHNLRLIFDAAHAFGSSRNGEAIGAQGDVQVFSLTPTKLVVAGEGGVVATNDERLANSVRIARQYGNRGDYNSEIAGLNALLPELSALLGRHSLRQLKSAVVQRNEIATYYRQRLGQLPGIGFQLVRSGNRSSYKDFSITIDDVAFGLSRDELADVLATENIDTRKYYDPPVHRQHAYRAYAPPDGSLPNTDRLAGSILDLPIWSHMEERTAADVCLAIERAHAFGVDIRARLRGTNVTERTAATF